MQAVTMKMKNSLLAVTGLFALSTGASSAFATDNCVFVKTSKSWILQADCSTDATIVVPSGVTVDGQIFVDPVTLLPDNYKITAIDPVGGNFVGPILKNGGAVMNVRNLILRTSSSLADVCNVDADKVVGILVNRAQSTISNVNIKVNKAAGTSICSEGVGIVAQSVPFDPKRAFSKVTITSGAGRTILKENQLGGVVARGNVSVRVEGALIKNLTGGSASIAQRGIEVSDKARAYILNNEIVRHTHTGNPADPAYGIYLNNAGQSTVLTNAVRNNDIGIRVSGGTKITLKQNTLENQTLDGILVDDANGVVTTVNSIYANSSKESGQNGIRLMSVNGLVTKNVVKSNITDKNLNNGILTEGSLNKIQSNFSGVLPPSSVLPAGGNDGLDIADAGTGNIYSKNACTTSSGAPVDCPVAVAP